MVNAKCSVETGSRSLEVSPLAVRYESIEGLRSDPRNARLHSRKQLRQIASSIASFGFNVPVLIDGERRVIAGHGRIEAAKQLGWTTVPAIAIEHLDAAQRRAFSIADNKLTDNSTWDDRLLAEQLKELAVLDLSFDIEATGFDMADIDMRIESLNEQNEGVDPADAPPPAAGQAVSRVGDIWKLGRHRVICGDALDGGHFAKLMEDKRADVVFTDPPYNVPIAGHVGGLGALRHREFPMASGEMTQTEFTRFLSTAFERLQTFSRRGSLHYICMDWRHLRELLAAADGVYGRLVNLCIWAKSNGGMGSLYRSQHELISVFKNGEAPHCNNVELGRHGRNRTNVWTYPGVTGFGRRTEEGVDLGLHPTVKPVALVADAILDCSRRGDLVLDAFLGGGTTLIAAERTGRICYGLELDPLYIDAAIRRWEAYAGEAATHASTERTFAQVAETRGSES